MKIISNGIAVVNNVTEIGQENVLYKNVSATPFPTDDEENFLTPTECRNVMEMETVTGYQDAVNVSIYAPLRLNGGGDRSFESLETPSTEHQEIGISPRDLEIGGGGNSNSNSHEFGSNELSDFIDQDQV